MHAHPLIFISAIVPCTLVEDDHWNKKVVALEEESFTTDCKPSQHISADTVDSEVC